MEVITITVSTNGDDIFCGINTRKDGSKCILVHYEANDFIGCVSYNDKIYRRGECMYYGYIRKPTINFLKVDGLVRNELVIPHNPKIHRFSRVI